MIVIVIKREFERHHIIVLVLVLGIGIGVGGVRLAGFPKRRLECKEFGWHFVF